jgi:hypothetical protein
MKSKVLRRMIFFSVLISIVGLISYLINQAMLGQLAESLNFSLAAVYLFFGSSALLIYLLMELATPFIRDKAGYLFLFAIMIKLGLFMLIFFGQAESGNAIPQAGKLSMIAALFIFIAIEGFAAYKVLNFSSED